MLQRLDDLEEALMGCVAAEVTLSPYLCGGGGDGPISGRDCLMRPYLALTIVCADALPRSLPRSPLQTMSPET